MIKKGHKKTVLQNKPCLLKQRATGAKVPFVLSLWGSGKGVTKKYAFPRGASVCGIVLRTVLMPAWGLGCFYLFLFPAGKVMITKTDPDFLIKI